MEEKPRNLADFAVAITFVAFLLVGLLWLGYYGAVRPSINAMYNQTFPIAGFNRLIHGQAVHPVSHFTSVAASWFRMFSLIILLHVPYFIWLGAAGRVRRRAARVGITLALYLGLAEIFMRIMLATPGHPNAKLKNPRLYANEYHDDLYWKLKIPWGFGEWPNPRRIHPELGWSQDYISTENPLGLEGTVLDAFQHPKTNAVLFYGDSFVQGFAMPEHRLPVLMAQALPDRQILDLGVSGYGVDQIYLLMKATAGHFPHSVALFGIMMYDLDRCELTMRHGQKPFFEIEEDALVLRGVPMFPDCADFLRDQPARPYSYVLRLLWTGFLQVARKDAEYASARRHIERMADKILEAVQAEATTHGTDVRVVLFYPRWMLDYTSWRESFLKEALGRRNMTFLDTKPALLGETDLASLYEPNGTHHNNAGNDVIARALVEFVK